MDFINVNKHIATRKLEEINMMLFGVAVLLSLNFIKLKTKLETLTLQFFSNAQNHKRNE